MGRRSAGVRSWLAVASAPDWVAAAVCAQVDPELFYPERGGSTRAAKQVCLQQLVLAPPEQPVLAPLVDQSKAARRRKAQFNAGLPAISRTCGWGQNWLLRWGQNKLLKTIADYLRGS